MNITWYGQSCFHFSFPAQKKGMEKTSLLIDPFQEGTGLKLPKIDPDIILITHDHFDHNNRSLAGKETFIIDSPGEYEMRNIFIQGIRSYHDESKGKERGLNTIYTIETEGMKLCHLGDLGQKELSSGQLKEIGEIDLLMLPVGGVYTIDAKKAAEVISQIEPRVVIPMHYKISGLKIELDELDSFLKAMGEKQAEAEEKLVLQKKDLPETEMKIIPLICQSKIK